MLGCQVGRPRADHGQEDPFLVLLGHPHPQGYFLVAPYLWRSTASKRRFLSPLVVPEVAHLTRPYTAITRDRALPPRGSGIASQSRNPIAPGLLCPQCRLRPRLLRLLRRCRVGRPRGSGHLRGFRPQLPCHEGGDVRGVAVQVGGRLVGGPGGLGEVRSPMSGSMM